MTPQELHESTNRIRSQHVDLQAQLRAAQTEVERAEIQRKMDAVMAEFRILQRDALVGNGPVRRSMAYYTALANAWNGGPQPPAGVTGAALTGTTAQKLAAINGWAVPAPAQKLSLPPSALLNAIVPADLAGLTTAQVTLLSLVLSGSEVDASAGTTVRAAMQAIFAGKTQTLQQLGALAATYDNQTRPWWQENGYSSPIGPEDLAVAGGLT